MQYYIYKITNLINGKAYVGQHKVYPGEAFTRYMGKGIAIRMAVQKYGKENFKKEILEEIDDDEKHEFTSEREKFWIAKLNTMQPNGYNLSPGGEGGCSPEAAAKVVATRKANGTNRHSTHTRKLMSEAAKGRKFTKEHRQHLSDHHHLKTEHTIIFEDGHKETTTEPLTVIAKRFGTSQNPLIRASAKKQFINGVMLEDIDPDKYACCKPYIGPSHRRKYKDPTDGTVLSYAGLHHRMKTHPEKYPNIKIQSCAIK